MCFDSAPAENVSKVVVAQAGQHLSGSGFRQLLQGPGASVPVFPWVLCRNRHGAVTKDQISVLAGLSLPTPPSF